MSTVLGLLDTPSYNIPEVNCKGKKHMHMCTEIVRYFRGVGKKEWGGGGERYIYEERERECALCHAPTLLKEAGSQVLHTYRHEIGMP